MKFTFQIEADDEYEFAEKIQKFLKFDNIRTVLYDFDQLVLRPVCKHGDETLSEEQVEIYHKLRDQLYEIIRQNDVDIFG